MTLFFLVVGLEAKRERDIGALHERGRLTVPVLAALAGIAASAGAYLLVTGGTAGAGGWGVALSTGTALALTIAAVAAANGCACSCSRSWSWTTSSPCWSSASCTPSGSTRRR
jgi:Na+/H+ antiporter NhaA